MTNKNEHQQAEGIWQFEKEVPVENDMGKQVNNTFTFMYANDRDAGDTVTLRLLTLRSGQWKTDDDFYKVLAKWEANTLYYLPPFGPWTELAIFEDDHFVNIGNGKKRIFQKVSKEEVVAWNHELLKEPRALHDYRIQPDGSLKP
jgi:hypothetical protein